MLMPPFLGEVCEMREGIPRSVMKWPRVSLCPGPIVPLGWLVGKTLAGDPGPVSGEALSPPAVPLIQAGALLQVSACCPGEFFVFYLAQVSIERNTDYWIHGAH